MLEKLYPKIKKSIVAIALNRQTAGNFPEIVGTGFFIHEDGVVTTNSHVIEGIKKITKAASPEELLDAIKILYFHYTENEGVKIVPLSADDVYQVVVNLQKDTVYYGNDLPDISIISLKNVKGCPSLALYGGDYLEGQEIATSGFPMGNRLIQNHKTGFVHQLSPTLQKGIVGAVLPCPCKTPHTLLIDIMMQGGSSGSPAFIPATGEVIGIVYERRLDILENQYITTTALSAIMPSWYLSEALDVYLKRGYDTNHKIPLSEWMKKQNIIKQVARKPFVTQPLQ